MKNSQSLGVCIVLAAALLLSGLPGGLYGQAVTASLAGTITGVSGAVLPGA